MTNREQAIAERVCMTPVGCDRCGLPFRSYMVLDEVWIGAARQPEYGALLCLPCLELAIGRSLQQNDFPGDYPANEWEPWRHAERHDLAIGSGVTIRLDADGGGLIWRHAACKAWMTLRYKPDPRSTGHVLAAPWPNLTIDGSLLCPAGCGKHGYIRNGRWVEA